MSDTLERFQPPEEIRQAFGGSDQEFFDAAWELAIRYKLVGRSREAVEYFFVAAALMERQGQHPRDVYASILELDPDNALAASRLEPTPAEQSRSAVFVQHVLSRHTWEQVRSVLDDERARNWVTPPRGKQRTCPDCGMGVPPASVRCEMCGAELPQPVQAEAPTAAVAPSAAPGTAPAAPGVAPLAPGDAPAAPGTAPAVAATTYGMAPAPAPGTAPAVAATTYGMAPAPGTAPAVAATTYGMAPAAGPGTAPAAAPGAAQAAFAAADAGPDTHPDAPWARFKKRQTAGYGVRAEDFGRAGDSESAGTGSSLESGTPPGQPAGPGPGQPGLVQLGQDASEAGWFPMSGGQMVVGTGEQAFAAQREEVGLEPQHVSVAWDGQVFNVWDMGSRTGVYLKVVGEATVEPGQMFQAGSHNFHLELPPSGEPGFRLVHLAVDGTAIAVHKASAGRYTVGRQGNDLDLPADPYLSDSHVEVTRTDRGLVVRDLGSAWGTFVRLPPEIRLPAGTILRVGRLLFRLDLK